MSQFKRKDQGGFETSDFPTTTEPEHAVAPDFSALEPQSGFSVENLGGAQVAPVREPESLLPRAESPAKQGEEPRRAPAKVEPAEAGPAKKRYYSPNEVMRKKGCIGCGGMVLAMPFLVTAIGIVIAIL